MNDEARHRIGDADLVRRIATRAGDAPGDAEGLDAIDLASLVGSWLDALLYARVLWPTFVETDDMVFMEGTFDGPEGRGRLDQVLAYCNNDRGLVERTANVFEVEDLFGGDEQPPGAQEQLALGEVVAELWASRLATSFPEREFTVAVLAGEQGGGEEEPVELTFFQSREDDPEEDLGERRPIVVEAAPDKPEWAPPRAPRPPRPGEAGE